MSDPVLAEITVIEGETDYTTPSAYVPETLFIYINGLLVQRDGTEAVDELGGNRFRLRESLKAHFTLHAYYQEKGPTHSPFPTPPRGLWALNLVPIRGAAIDLVPAGDAEESETIDYMPEGTVALNLVPEPGAALNLVPRPISAEEV